MSKIEIDATKAARAFETIKMQAAEIERLTKQAAAGAALSDEQAYRVAKALVHAGKAQAHDLDRLTKMAKEKPENIIGVVERLANEVAAIPTIGSAAGQTKKASANGTPVRTSKEIWESGFGSI